MYCWVSKKSSLHPMSENSITRSESSLLEVENTMCEVSLPFLTPVSPSRTRTHTHTLSLSLSHSSGGSWRGLSSLGRSLSQSTSHWRRRHWEPFTTLFLTLQHRKNTLQSLPVSIIYFQEKTLHKNHSLEFFIG